MRRVTRIRNTLESLELQYEEVIKGKRFRVLYENTTPIRLAHTINVLATSVSKSKGRLYLPFLNEWYIEIP